MPGRGATSQVLETLHRTTSSERELTSLWSPPNKPVMASPLAQGISAEGGYPACTVPCDQAQYLVFLYAFTHVIYIYNFRHIFMYLIFYVNFTGIFPAVFGIWQVSIASDDMKTKDHQFDYFVVAGGTISCHYDKLRCHQWQQSC